MFARPSIRPLVAAIASIAAIAMLAGCAGGTAGAQEPEASTPGAQSVPLAELDLLDDPLSWHGESTAMLASASITAVEESPSQTLPATVTSHDLDGDTEVTVDETSRVLGLDMSGSVAATIVGLGFADSLVGRDVSSTFAEVADLPVVTSGGHSINNESVLALRPTLVITDGTIGPIDVILQLRDAGIPVVFVDAEPGFDGVGQLARQVAAAFGAPDAGELLATALQQQIDAKVAEIAGIAPKAEGEKLRMLFLYLRGGSGIYYLFGSESGVDDIITGLGGIDVAAEIGWTGMKPMTDEAVISARPDLILVMTSGLESAGGVDQLLDTKLALAQTPAGMNRRFVDMADGQVLSFGPRTADVLDALARAVYAPAA
ncbi:iron complex transport system substrate-binding protein [Homoserinimonas aerilata]|uniref:Iron complex transport system substrate-binding protein n=1 Tax=Homoserinimonas aerilata TaxID=1162970 RepID=A0A542YG33_9MICO|nr:ABC transporter substrate-binding protein [Homoserinimonas aerilata]TQL47048.1 iron complex transport system substrate-binding protein [Homoserinimonas aerilata]